MAKKPTPKFDYERASRVLAQAALEGDAKAAQTEGITVRTIQNYRRRLNTDETLSLLFAEKKAVLENNWANEIAPTLRAALAFIKTAAQSLDPRDPEAVHAMAGAFKLINEGHQTLKVIDARLAEHHRESHETARPLVTEPTHHPVN